ncbi:DUF305 domain-containing protein [Pseudomonas sp. MWU16-30317]|uniref:CopM family metallochaperone n=1 Tax=Pseudomonas sp. MWU16-30317 TaxID=2878095 RepID=UPI001CFACD5F|nr:DUF305 domain-containing protein [Pseudomonas sp. MWU16-30317]
MKSTPLLFLVAAALSTYLWAADPDANPNIEQMHKDYMAPMSQMSESMHKGVMADDPDVAFASGMLAHHEGAVAMARVQLKYGKDAQMRKLAENVIKTQEAEIVEMKAWLAKHPTSGH